MNKISLCLFFCLAISNSNFQSRCLAQKSASEVFGNAECIAFSYGGYRGPTRDDVPSVDNLKEDMRILSAMGVKLIRTYNTQQFKQAENLLQAIESLRKENAEFEMYVMLGVWIDCQNAWTENADHQTEDERNNRAEIAASVRMANKYPQTVKAIAVGNEAMVHWATNYFVQPGTILKWVNHLQDLKRNGKLSEDIWITSSDNFAAWGGAGKQYHKPDLAKLIHAVDFVSMHTYPFHDSHYESKYWIAPKKEASLSVQQRAELAVTRAVDRAKDQYESVVAYVRSVGATKPVHIGETGWASVCSSLYGASGSQAADEYKAGMFYKKIRQWTQAKNISCFYFEAFNEKWKDLGDANGSENHFGLIDLNGNAKFAIWDKVDEGTFDGLTRGGRPITKSLGGDRKKLIASIMPVPTSGNWDGKQLDEVNQNRDIGTAVTEKNYIVLHESKTPANFADSTFASQPVKLNVWEGTCELDRVGKEMHVVTGTGAWWGCALEIQSDDRGENLTKFRDGTIHFEIRGDTESKFRAGFQTGRYVAGNQTNNGVMFGPGESYQLTKDWKLFAIPVKVLIAEDPKANLEDVTSLFYLKGEKQFDGKGIQLKNVRYSR